MSQQFSAEKRLPISPTRQHGVMRSQVGPRSHSSHTALISARCRTAVASAAAAGASRSPTRSTWVLWSLRRNMHCIDVDCDATPSCKQHAARRRDKLRTRGTLRRG